MDVIQMLNKCALIFALIATRDILGVQGRHFKPTNDQDSSKHTNTPTTAAAEKNQDFQLTPQDHNIPSITTAHHHSASGLGDEDAFRSAPRTPGKGPGFGHSYTFRPVPTTLVKGLRNGHPYAFRPAPTLPGKGHGHVYAFLLAPTTPGKNRGNGNYYANENEEVEARGANYNGRYSTTGAKDDFRHTSPGHSPGVGHAIGKNAQPNA